MKYICESCGQLIDEHELTGKADRHYAHNGLGYECVAEDWLQEECGCGGYYVEGKQCELCGELYSLDELHSGVCKECLKEHATPDNAVLFGMAIGIENDADTTEGVLSLFTEAEILQILIEEKQRILKSGDSAAIEKIKKRASKYLLLDSDTDDFAEFIKEKKL